MPSTSFLHAARSHATGLAGAALAAAGAVVLVACGGGSTGPAVLEKPAARPEALNASAPGELLAFMKDRIEKRWAAGLSGSGAYVMTTDFVVTTTAAPAATGAATTGFSSTTVQEAGVDEDDLMKTDGSLIYSLVPPSSGKPQARLLVHRRQDNGRAQAAAELLLPTPEGLNYPTAHGLQLAASGGKVAVVAQGWQGGVSPCPPGLMCTLPYLYTETREQVSLDIVAVGNPAAPRLENRIQIDGSLVGTRRIGDALYLVSSWTPRLALGVLPASAPAADRSAALAKLGTTDLMPTIRIDGGAAQPLLQDTDCWLQPANASLDLRLTVITRFDLAAGTLTRSSRCIAGGSEALYMSPSSLVLATTRYPVTTLNGSLQYPATTQTDLHKFALGAAGVDYRGSGSVPGHLGWNPEQKSDRISDFNGDLRVLTFTGETGWFFATTLASAIPPAGASPATLSVLRERAGATTSDRSLQLVGQLPSAQRPAWIGHPGEQVYAVRFAGDRAYVVTFRRTDPLYVLDLSNPADPRIAGELKMPGFSDYLYPLPSGLLFGVGRDATDDGRATGVKVGLFDVSDMANPKELATRSFGVAGSSTALSYSRHGINLFTQGSSTRIALPMFIRDAVPGKSQQGLQRFEVDSAAKTLLVKPLLGAVSTEYEEPGNPLSWQRSVQIGAQVHWLNRGDVSSWDW